MLGYLYRSKPGKNQGSILRGLLFLLVYLYSFSASAQCALGTASGVTIVPCIGNYSTSPLNTGQYALLNVIQGFTYQISSNCAGFNAEITLYDNTNTQIGFNNNTTVGGCTYTQAILNYTATYTGQIKVNLTENSCLSSGKADNLKVTVTSATNTLDNPLAEGTGTGWIGHMYNEPTMDNPGGPPATITFSNYEGYFMEPGSGPANLNFIENFGTGNAPYCFPVLSNGSISVNQNVDNISDRFRNKNTLDGIYQITIGGDDGIRLFMNTPNDLTTPAGNGTSGSVLAPGIGNAIWKDQGYTTKSALLSLNGANDGTNTGFNHFVIEFYQHHGQIRAGFNITGADNIINTLNSTVCSGSNASISGSYFQSVYPAATFQWQVATSPTGTFSNVVSGIGGATQNYEPDLQNLTASPVTYYFRRMASTGGVTHYSPCIVWTVSPESTNLYNVTGGGSYCAGSTGPAINLSGSQTGLTYNLQALAPGGLFAQYYGSNQTVSGVPTFTRIDPAVNFYLGAWPGGGIGPTNFSTRWTGKILAPSTGNYIFSTNSDDGVRVWINGVQVINDWNDHPSTVDNSAAIPLTAGSYNDIVVEFYQNGGGANINLSWTLPTGGGSVIIPTTNLYSLQTVNSLSGTGSALTFPNNTAPGVYSIVASNGAGCTRTMNGTVTVTVNPVPTASVTSHTDVSCFGNSTGTATAAGAGGTPFTVGAPYHYLWSNGQTTQTAINLAQGTYTVTVSDQNGCSSSTASVTISQPGAALSATTTKTDVSCFGGNNGTATVAATGGTAGYTYSWSTSPIQTGITASGLTQGTYTVTVTDNKGCTTTASTTVGQPAAALSATTTKTDVSCFGGNNGSASVTVAGGTPTYTYSWNTTPVQTSNTATGLTQGVYTVTITDGKGCTTSASATVGQPAAALSATTTKTDVSCFGGNNGSATVTVTGGTAGYTYSWSTSPIQTGITASGLSQGTYTVTVTDNNGCTTTATATVSQPAAALSATTTKTDVSCFGGNNGSASVTVAGGTPTYTYSWNTSPIQTGITATGLTQGVYTVTIIDGKGCTTSASATVGQPAAALSATTTKTDVSCFGGNNGSATVTVTGGTAGYTYSWSTSPIQTGITASGLSQGTYTVTITDNKGCTSTATATVGQPAAALSATTTKTDVSCFGGNNGSATVSVAGGTPTYTYSWNTTPIQTGITASGLSQGTYAVTVTDNKGCTTTATATVGQPAAALSATTTKTDVSCFGGNNGSATVTAAGGTGPYVYSWSTTPIQTGITASGLSQGTYTVTITDNKGCTSTATATVGQPAAALSATTTKTDVSCFGGNNGSATVSVAGGTPTYTYSWNTAPVQTSITATGLTQGVYTVTITDGKGCTTSASATVGQPAAALSATTAETDVSCFGGNNGTATVTATGGTAGYTYSWSTSPIQTGITASGLSQGTYTVTITDNKGCATTATATVGQPAASLSASTTKTDVSCFGGNNGSATVTVTGGTPTYTYSWNSTPVQTTATATGLTQGTYTVTVTDNKGCTTTATATVSQPAAALSATTTKTDVSCFGGNNGTATVTVTGGTPTYTYSWNSTPVQTTATATGLTQGTYTVTITDNKGCTTTATATVSQPAAALSATTTKTDVSCFGGNNGTATVTVTGGTPTFSYSWNTTPVQTTATATGLTQGIYTVTITDNKGCTTTASATVSQPAASLSASTTKTDVSCFGGNNGSATVTGTGGTPTYTYSWNTSPIQTGITATGLTQGVYTVTITDGKGCTTTASATVGQPAAALSASTIQTDVTCRGASTGSATVSIAGGTPGYTYIWNTSPAQNGATAIGLVAGMYQVTVTDQKGCSLTKTVTISQPAVGLTAVISSKNDNKCKGDTNGSATVLVTGGTGTYNYSWNTTPIQNTATASGLSAGTYIVTVTDASSCVALQTVTITEPGAVLGVQVKTTNVKCSGDANGTAQATASGGTGPYLFTWSTTPVQMGSSITGLQAGTYSVFVQDAGGCSMTQSVVIGSNKPAIATGVSVIAQAGKDVVFPILTNDKPGSVAIDASSVDLDQSKTGVQHELAIAGKGLMSVDNTGNLTFKPLNNYTGTVTASYQIADVNGCLSNLAVINISIQAQAPIARNDTASTSQNQSTSVSILANDIDPQGSTLSAQITSAPGHGQAVVLAGGVIKYSPDAGFSGTDVISYQAFNSLSPSLYSNTATLTIKVRANPGSLLVLVPTAFTPNGDGQNDLFVIKNLDLYPDNELQIFNRWGNQVYHAKQYMQRGQIWDGSNLGDGTYFYVLTYTSNGKLNLLKGYTTILHGK